MYSKIETAAVTALQVFPVSVEVDISEGMPVFDMVGLLSGEVKEARERVRTALKQAGCRLPPKRVTINLSPAALRKSGSGYDLAIAAGILQALGHACVSKERLAECLFLGELNLEGRVLPVRGVLPVASYAKETGKKWFFVPEENKEEAGLVGGAKVIGLQSIKQLLDLLCHPENWKEIPAGTTGGKASVRNTLDFSEIHGQQTVKRAAKIAAAGRHNLLLIGAPGTGKSMIASRLPGILPELSEEESLEITKVYSIAGKLEGDGRVRIRPFRTPHHTCSRSGMAGGGREPLPGEITLAHGGVLFLDEFPEFSRGTIEVLRQPMEERKVTIIRAGGEYCFPADFMLVAAMNPCPCGYYPDLSRCTCTPYARNQYFSKVKGPILDRMDLCVMAPRVTYRELLAEGEEESSEEIRKQTEKVWQMQKSRFQGESFVCNARIPAGKMKTYVKLAPDAGKLAEDIYETMKLGARGYHRLLRVARTIADMDGEIWIQKNHLAEAASYRLPEEVFS